MKINKTCMDLFVGHPFCEAISVSAGTVPICRGGGEKSRTQQHGQGAPALGPCRAAPLPLPPSPSEPCWWCKAWLLLQLGASAAVWPC